MSDIIIDAIRQAERAHRAEEAEREAEHAAWEADWQRRQHVKDTQLMPKLRPASVAEYAAFVADYLTAGGQIRYVRDSPMRRVWVAREDFTLPGLCGAAAIDILVPKGIHYLGGDRGHCTLYFADGPSVAGSGVELYSDVAAYLKARAEAGP
jgi:hypothetical protein